MDFPHLKQLSVEYIVIDASAELLADGQLLMRAVESDPDTFHPLGRFAVTDRRGLREGHIGVYRNPTAQRPRQVSVRLGLDRGGKVLTYRWPLPAAGQGSGRLQSRPEKSAHGPNPSIEPATFARVSPASLPAVAQALPVDSAAWLGPIAQRRCCTHSPLPALKVIIRSEVTTRAPKSLASTRWMSSFTRRHSGDQPVPSAL